MSGEGTGGRRDVRLTPPPRIEPVGAASSRRWILPLAILAVALVAAVVLFLTPVPTATTPGAGQEQVAEESEGQGSRDAGSGTRLPAAVDRERAPAPRSEARDLGGPETKPMAGAGGGGAPSRTDDAFGAAMAEGIAAVDAGDWQAGRDAFSLAASLRPDSPEPAAGLARLEAATGRVAIEGLFERARELEGSEAWHQAAAAYRSILDMDPTLTSAREGLRSAEARSLLSDRLTYHLENPERLSADAVLEEADRLLATARGVTPAGPRHREQVAALAERLDRQRAPVRVALVSDALTEVTVFQVGRLGAFSRRELELRPGTYTVVGSRAGYRDVRRQLTVAPGGPPEPFEIRCEEKI